MQALGRLFQTQWIVTFHEGESIQAQGNEKVKVEVAQPCLILCDTVDCTVHGILQARMLERVAFPFFRGPSQLRDQTQVSHIAGRFFIC